MVQLEMVSVCWGVFAVVLVIVTTPGEMVALVRGVMSGFLLMIAIFGGVTAPTVLAGA